MISYNIFLALAFAVGFVSSRSNLFNGTQTAWDHPEFAAKYPALSDAVALGAQNYDPIRVMSAMRLRNDDLKIITAHRGISGPKCPENTICAVDAAIRAGIESVEIDVRGDKNGHLWPIHDQRIGRVTNYAYPGYDVFDPYTDRAEFPSNPLIATMSTSGLSALKTRDSQQNVCDDFVDLEAILYHIKEKGNIAVMLDVKTKDAIKSSADMLRALDMTSVAGVKFLDTLLDPSNSEDMAILNGINFVPVQFLATQDAIAKNGAWWRSAGGAVIHYDSLYIKQESFLNFEISCKMWTWYTIWGWLPDGPTAFLQYHFKELLEPKSLGTFVPTPDVQKGYFTSDGTCCVNINSFLATSTYFGKETRDDRPKVDAMVSTHDILIADDVSQVYTYAKKYGYREIGHILKSRSIA